MVRILLPLSVAALILSCGGGSSPPVTSTEPGPSPSMALIAGSVGGGPVDVDAVGTNARFLGVGAIASDRAGNLYVADYALVRKVAPDGTVSTLAGQQVDDSGPPQTRLDGTGPAARFGMISAIATDPAGSIYVIDAVGTFVASMSIRKITADGVVTTVANSVEVLFGTPTADPRLSTPPTGIAVDAQGNIFASGRNTIWKLTPAGSAIALAGSATAGNSDGTGSAASFNDPSGLALDPAGNLWVADRGNHAVRKVSATGSVTTVAVLAPASYPSLAASFTGVADIQLSAIAVEASGTVAVVSYCGVGRIDPASGTVTTVVASPANCGPSVAAPAVPQTSRLGGVAATPDGRLYVTPYENREVRRIDAGGNVSVFAGAGLYRGYRDGPAASALFRGPTDVAADGAGNLYVADVESMVIRKIDVSGNVTTLAGTDEVGGDQDGVGTQATFHRPIRIAVTRTGTVYVAGKGLRRVSPAGVVTTVPVGSVCPDTSLYFEGVAADAQENVYFSCQGTVWKMTPDGAMKAIARRLLSLMTVNAKGDLYGVDCRAGSSPLTATCDIDGLAKITPDGTVTVKPLPPPSDPALVLHGMDVDADGNVYMSEGYLYDRPEDIAAGAGTPGFIRKIGTDGAITTLAGNASVAATLLGPLPGAVLDPWGIRLIAPNTLAVALPDAGVIKVVVP